MIEESAPQGKSQRWKPVVTFRRLSGSFAVVLIVALTVTSINSVSSSNISSISEQVQAKPYDGETLYRGLFFASGPVVGKIPTLSKAARYFPAEYKSLESQITRYIRGKDPTFFNRFAAEIQSGDRVRVAAALRSANKLQKQAVLEVTKTSRTPFAQRVRRSSSVLRADPETDKDKDKDLALVVVTDKDIAIVLIYIITDIPVAETPTELRGIKFEQYVDEVVRAVPRARTAVLHP